MSAASPVEREISTIIADFLAEIGRPPADAIHHETVLEDDLAIYSLERLELILRLERIYGVPLKEAATLHAVTVGDLASLVGSQCRPAPPIAAQPTRSGEVAVQAASGSILFTAYAGALVLAIGAAVWVMLHVIPPGKRAARLLQRAVRILFPAAGCRIDVSGEQHLEGIQPAVLVANHQSYLDSLVLLASLPLLPNVVVNERLPGAPFVGKAVRAARFLTVDRRSLSSRLAFTDEMRRTLASGESLLVFPEATFDTGPGLLPFRLGAFAAAAAAGRPVIPITLQGTREMLPCDARLLRRARLSVTIHPPLLPRNPSWAEAVRLRDEARARITRPAVQESV